MTEKEFYECLFDRGELTVHGDNIFATRPSKAITNGIKATKPFFVINPIKEGKTRSVEGVKAFRNFLFEIDDDQDGNSVSLEIQKEIVQAAQLPWSTCTFSGGKSLHWIISLQTPLEDAVEYRIWWKMMESILNKTARGLGYSLKFDKNVKDPSRFSRSPGAVRIDKYQIQQLQGVRGRQKNDDVISWFKMNQTHFEDFVPKPTQFEIGQINELADDVVKFRYIIDVLMKNQEYVKGNGNNWQFTFARLARRCGILEPTTRNQMLQYCGEIDHRNPIESAYSDKYSQDEPIYVMTPEERGLWAKQKALEEETITRDEIVQQGRSEEYLHINGIHDYIRVGTSYFKKSKEKLTPWNKETLTSDFGGDYIKQFPDELKYEGFVNQVEFIEETKRNDRQYNRFKKPEWPELTPGKWPTTEKLLRKVFSDVGQDQYEVGLDWIQLQLTKPKQMLHCLILGSESREAGKDTFILWMKHLLGKHNVYFSDIENFLKPFNSPYADKCLIALNEVKFSSINDGSMEKIKQYVTQDTVLIDEKFQVPVELDYYGKVVMLTNNVHDFMKIDDEENRFWIRTMPKLNKKKDFDPNFMTKLEEELGHFLHYITNRKLHTEGKQTRFYLSDSVTQTEELARIRENSKSSLYMEIHSMLDDTFFQRKDVDDLYFLIGNIRDKIETPNIGMKQIKMCLQKEFRLQPKKQLRVNSFSLEERNCSYFHVKRSEFYQTPDTTPGLEDIFTV